MPKFTHLLALSLILTTIAPACDAVDEQAVADPGGPVVPREAQSISSKVEDIDYGRKMIAACFEYSEVASIQLTTYDPFIDGLQGYVLLIESNAPITELECAWGALEEWGQQP